MNKAVMAMGTKRKLLIFQQFGCKYSKPPFFSQYFFIFATMKTFLPLVLFCTLAFTAAAGDYSKYYTSDLPVALSEPALPSIPDNTVVVSDFGAIGDGITDCTEAFRKAISGLAKLGGGHLVVPAGIWLTGPIVLKDHIDLHLDKGSVVLFSPNREAFLKDGRVMPCISAGKRTDISITGYGIIDGNGEWWRAVKRGKVSDVEWKDFKRMGGTEADGGKLWYPFALKHGADIASDFKAQEKMRTHMIRLTDCERVLVQGVTIQNSPKFHLVPTRCNNVIIDGVTVRCPWNAQNGDGIDLMYCQDVLIVNNKVDVGDDGICLKAGGGAAALKYPSNARILIQDNTVFHAHGGFVIGSEFSAGVQDVVVRCNTFSGTDTGLRFKSAPGRGGKTSNLYISDIFMSDIRDQAIVFETSYVDVPVGSDGKRSTAEDFLPEFTDIHISNVVCRDARTGISAKGEVRMIHDIDISDCTIFCTETLSEIEDPAMLNLENVSLSTY